MRGIFISFLISSICSVCVHSNAISSRLDVVATEPGAISQSQSKHSPRIVLRDGPGGLSSAYPPTPQSSVLPSPDVVPQIASLSPTSSNSNAGLGGSTVTVARITRIRSIAAAPGACKFAPAPTVYVTTTQLVGPERRDIQTVTQTIWQTQTVTTTSYATETYYATSTVSVTVQSAYVAYSVPTSSPTAQSDDPPCSTSPGAITDAQGCSMNVQQRSVVANVSKSINLRYDGPTECGEIV